MNIIELAKEAGFNESKQFEGIWIVNQDEVNAFAALVAAHEREACANVCAQLMPPWDENTPNHEIIALRNDGMRQCAAAIRARGEK